MKFVYSFVFSHSCRCVLVYSFHRLHCPDADCALPPMWHPVNLQSRAVSCPGIGEHRSRKENMELGIPVAEEKWAEVLAM